MRVIGMRAAQSLKNEMLSNTPRLSRTSTAVQNIVTPILIEKTVKYWRKTGFNAYFD